MTDRKSGMTRQAALDLLHSLAKASSEDPETAHAKADEVLLMLINDAEITEAFEAITRWYA